MVGHIFHLFHLVVLGRTWDGELVQLVKHKTCRLVPFQSVGQKILKEAGAESCSQKKLEAQCSGSTSTVVGEQQKSKQYYIDNQGGH